MLYFVTEIVSIDQQLLLKNNKLYIIFNGKLASSRVTLIKVGLQKESDTTGGS